MYIMCLIIFEDKAEVQDQYPWSLNAVQKADDHIQDRNRNIGPIAGSCCFHKIVKHSTISLSPSFLLSNNKARGIN